MKNALSTRIAYGCEEFGRLTTVMMHRPGNELRIIDKENHHHWLFDEVPDIDRFIGEHDRYRELLISHDIEVIELSNHVSKYRDLIERMPNLTYQHDIAVISSYGAILSAMAWDSRRHEELVVREALENLGIPIFIDFSEPEDAFEGCLLLSPDTILVAETERHSRKTTEKFIGKALTHFEEIIYVDVPKARRFMHPDTIYNRLTTRLALAYLPAFNNSYVITTKGIERIDFVRHMLSKGVEIISVSDSEQLRLACSFVALEPGVIFHYNTALNKETQIRLARKGVEIIFFHPQALNAGGGSLRCLTLRLRREHSE